MLGSVSKQDCKEFFIKKVQKYLELLAGRNDLQYNDTQLKGTQNNSIKVGTLYDTVLFLSLANYPLC